MTDPDPSSFVRRFAALALAASLAAAAPALAQDPAADQYSPAPSSGAVLMPPDNGSGGGKAAPSPAASARPGEIASATSAKSSTAARGADPVVTAQRRNAVSERGGMGMALWIIAGASLLWAITSGALKLRGRGVTGPVPHQASNAIARKPDPPNTPDAHGGQTA